MSEKNQSVYNEKEEVSNNREIKGELLTTISISVVILAIFGVLVYLENSQKLITDLSSKLSSWIF